MPASIDEVQNLLREQGYISDRGLAVPIFLALTLQRPLFLEGEAGVGKTEIARALATDPECLLIDEPFGALDAITRDALQQEFLDLKHRLAKTVVFVTHDIVEALTLGDRIAILHEGRLEQVATGKEILQHPATPFIRDLFAKTVNRLKAFKDTI